MTQPLTVLGQPNRADRAARAAIRGHRRHHGQTATWEQPYGEDFLSIVVLYLGVNDKVEESSSLTLKLIPISKLAIFLKHYFVSDKITPRQRSREQDVTLKTRYGRRISSRASAGSRVRGDVNIQASEVSNILCIWSDVTMGPSGRLKGVGRSIELPFSNREEPEKQDASSHKGFSPKSQALSQEQKEFTEGRLFEPGNRQPGNTAFGRPQPENHPQSLGDQSLKWADETDRTCYSCYTNTPSFCIT